ncbi:MAG: hypothetical protein M1819_005088 [Sarea resinae]|nr:MAG: hypothetical protein M1819_005088 [Sarea resinae]
MHTSPPFRIEPVRTESDLRATVALFTAYADWLGIDLSFQDFSTELASMPGKYAPPAGELLLARLNSDNTPIGCIALRPMLPKGFCEVKRLYVLPAGRGMGIGKALVEAIVDVAHRLGYEEMRLDSLPTLVAALKVYQRAGFVRVERYNDTPLTETIFLGRSLPGKAA